MESLIDVKWLKESLLGRYSLKASLFLGLGDIIIQVKSNSEILIADLRRYFREFISWESHENILIYAIETDRESFFLPFQEKEPDPGKTKIKEEYCDLPDGRIVRKRLTGIVLIFNGQCNLAVGPCTANSNQIVNFINNRFIEWMLRRGSLLAHAAGVCLGERGLSIAGFSGTGKTTLALHLLTHGATFVSNDRLLVDCHDKLMRMYGVSKHPRVNPGTLLAIPGLETIMSEEEREDFGLLEGEDLWALEHKYDVIIDEVFGKKRFNLSAPLNGLLLLNWKRNDAPLTIRPIDIAQRPDLLAAFIKSPGLFFLPESAVAPPDLSPDRYVNILKRCEVFEASGGVNFDGAVDFCLDFLNREGSGHVGT